MQHKKLVTDVSGKNPCEKQCIWGKNKDFVAYKI